MKKLIICLCVFSMALVTSASYAENDMGYVPIDPDDINYMYYPAHGELSPATTIILCGPGQGDVAIQVMHDLAITSFTETAYDKVRNERIAIRRYSNIRYDESHEVVDYTIYDESFLVTYAQPAIEERITRGPGIDLKLVDPNIRIDPNYVFQRTPITIKNRLGSVVLGYFYGTFSPNTRVPIGIVIGYPEDNFRRIEVSEVVISNLNTGRIFAVVDKVEMGYDNQAVLQKLDEIHQDVKGNRDEISNAVSLLKTIRKYVSIYNYVRRTYVLVNNINGYVKSIYRSLRR